MEKFCIGSLAQAAVLGLCAPRLGPRRINRPYLVSSRCFTRVGDLGKLSLSSRFALLTAIYWGRWQASLSKDDRGPASPYLAKILATHWIRTLLINAYGLILLVWTLHMFA
jgi:hypothetical protein